MPERARATTASSPEKRIAKPARAPEKLTEKVTERLTLERRYTAKDFTALRAFVQRIAPAVIARTYYDPDEDPHAATPGAMERHLTTMLDALVSLALAHGSSVLAEHLSASIRQHGRPLLTAVTFRMVADAAQLAAAPPHPDHPIGAWLRPRVARRLKGEGIGTLGELVAFCNRRGGSWWRSIPRIGPGRARAIVSWLRKQQASLQLTIEADVDSEEQDGVPLIAAELVEVAPAARVTESGPSSGQSSGSSGGQGGPESASRLTSRLVLAPLERLAVPHALSGADGENRATAFCYIQAKHDLDAVRAYLNRYRDQPKTLRAYTKELERFSLWTVVLRGKALSDLKVDDCEAYKDFLKSPDPRFVGERFARHSPRWRPFALSASGALSSESQRYAVRVLRGAFAWLVDVRYLAGDPWTAVNDPPVIKRASAMRIERALSAELWRKLRDALDARSAEAGAIQSRESRSSVQWRAVRSAILLMGDSGLRREEAASARRENLRPSAYGTLERPVWELTIVGKGQRERTVPVSAATLVALRAHWADRAQDFDGAAEESHQGRPLLAPVVIPFVPTLHAGDIDPGSGGKRFMSSRRVTPLTD